MDTGQTEGPLSTTEGALGKFAVELLLNHGRDFVEGLQMLADKCEVPVEIVVRVFPNSDDVTATVRWGKRIH